MPRAVVAAYAACALIWGTTWYAIRVCISAYPTLDALALRFAIATVILLPIAARCRPWPTGRAWLWLGVAGVLDAAGYLLVYSGEERVPGGVAAVLSCTEPLIVAVLLAATGLERVSKRYVLGALVSLAGVAVIFVDRLGVSREQGVGVALVLAAAIVVSIYTLMMKRHGEGVHAVVTSALFIVVTALVLGALALVAREPLPSPLPLAPTAALLYLAIVGSVIAFVIYFWMLGKVSVQITSTLVFAFPLVALAADALFERDPIGARAYAGAAIVLGGLAVSLRRA